MKLIILDRDGVINQDSDAYIKAPDEWVAIDSSLEAIAKLSRAGYHVFVATNQSGLARGLFDIDTLNAIHRKMTDAVQEKGGSIEAILFCPHGPDEHCHCRKPEPGLYEAIGLRTQQSLEGIPIVGDSLRDIEAAVSVRARPYMVLTGKGRREIAGMKKRYPRVPVFDDLLGLSNYLIDKESSKQ